MASNGSLHETFSSNRSDMDHHDTDTDRQQPVRQRCATYSDVREGSPVDLNMSIHEEDTIQRGAEVRSSPVRRSSVDESSPRRKASQDSAGVDTSSLPRSRSQDVTSSCVSALNHRDGDGADDSDLDHCASLSEYEQGGSSGPPSSVGMIRSGTYDVLSHIPPDSQFQRVSNSSSNNNKYSTTVQNQPEPSLRKQQPQHHPVTKGSSNFNVIKEVISESVSSSSNSSAASNTTASVRRRGTPTRSKPNKVPSNGNLLQEQSHEPMVEHVASVLNNTHPTPTTRSSSRSRTAGSATLTRSPRPSTTSQAIHTRNSSRLSTSSDRASSITTAEENQDSGSLFQYFVDVNPTGAADFASLTPAPGISGYERRKSAHPVASTPVSVDSAAVASKNKPQRRINPDRCLSSRLSMSTCERLLDQEHRTRSPRTPPPSVASSSQALLTTSASGGFMFFDFGEENASTGPKKNLSPPPARLKSRQQNQSIDSCMSMSFETPSISSHPQGSRSSTPRRPHNSSRRPTTGKKGPSSVRRDSLETSSRCDSRERFHTVMDSDRVVVVTVSTSGIGEATILSFVREWDPHLVIAGRNLDLITALAIRVAQLSHSKKKPLTVVGDLTSSYYCERLVSECIAKLGRLDVLVNSCTLFQPFNMAPRAGIEDVKFIENLESVMKCNVMSLIRLTRLAVPHLVATQGIVVNITFLPPKEPSSLSMIYSMSKSMMDTFTQCLAADLAPKGVRVNTINPGPIDTMTMHSVINGSLGKHKSVVAESCSDSAGGAGVPQDVSKLILFLSSERSSYLSGQNISLNT